MSTEVEKFIATNDGNRLFLKESAKFSCTELILKMMRDQEVSQSELARRLGKSRGWVSQLLSDDGNRTIETLSDVFFCLGYSLQISAISLDKSSETR